MIVGAGQHTVLYHRPLLQSSGTVSLFLTPAVLTLLPTLNIWARGDLFPLFGFHHWALATLIVIRFSPQF